MLRRILFARKAKRVYVIPTVENLNSWLVIRRRKRTARLRSLSTKRRRNCAKDRKTNWTLLLMTWTTFFTRLQNWIKLVFVFIEGKPKKTEKCEGIKFFYCAIFSFRAQCKAKCHWKFFAFNWKTFSRIWDYHWFAEYFSVFDCFQLSKYLHNSREEVEKNDDEAFQDLHLCRLRCHWLNQRTKIVHNNYPRTVFTRRELLSTVEGERVNRDVRVHV